MYEVMMMTKNRWHLVVAILVCLAVCGCQPAGNGGPCLSSPAGLNAPGAYSVPFADGGFSLTVMHLNDTHSQLVSLQSQSLILDGTKTYVDMGGFARIRTKVDAIRDRQEPSLLLHAGDAVQGTLYFTLYHGDADMAALNLLGVDAMVVGNHEFDKGPDLLAALTGTADFPMLGGNIDCSREPLLQEKIKNYVIKNVGNEKIGIIGLTTPETAFTSSPGSTVTFDDVVGTAGKMVGELEAMGVDKIIALTHEGFKQDIALAEAVDGIDLIVGGHSHSLLGDEGDIGLVSSGPYPVRTATPDGAPVYIVQAWAKGRELGVARVDFDEHGVIEKFQGNPVIILGDTFKQKNSAGKKVVVDASTRQRLLDVIQENPGLEVVPEDAAMAALLKPYTAGIQDMEAEVVARVAEDLSHVRVPGRDRNRPRPDCPEGSWLAPLVADSLIWKASANGLNVDLSLQNGGGIRTGLCAGDLTVGDGYTLLPFGNTLVVLGLTGMEIAAALEQGVDKALAGHGGAFPYPGNARYRVDLHGAHGKRVSGIEVRNTKGAWLPLDREISYRVAVNSYNAGGGDGYSVLEKANGYRYDTGFVDAEIFLEYARQRQVLEKPAETGVMVVDNP
jgi:5'-nucleotidase